MRSFILSTISVFLLCCLLISVSHAQDNPAIRVEGKILDDKTPVLQLPMAMIVNLRTQQGIFANNDNSFSISLLKNDTLAVMANGYAYRKFSFRDSVYKPTYYVTVQVQRLSMELKEINIARSRDLPDIEKDFKKLGYHKSDYTLQGVDAVRSPFTALYQEFSKKERGKREVAQLMNNDRRKELIQEVLKNYSDHDLIQIDSSQMDDFIVYLGLNDYMLQVMTQYELAVYIRERYVSFSNR